VNRVLSNATFATTSSVQDWYEAHYLSICSGMWNTHRISAGKNSSTVICASQNAGYTFSLAQIFASSSNATQPQPRPLLIDSSSSSLYGTLDTKAPLILLTIGIALTGLSVLFFLYGVVIMLVTYTAKMPLGVVRVSYLTSLAVPTFLTISSAKITSLAEKTTGTADVNIGGVAVAVHAWTERGFYAFIWLGTALMWVVVGLSIAAAFKFASALQIRDPLSLGLM
jgi:hypothetical protein